MLVDAKKLFALALTYNKSYAPAFYNIALVLTEQGHFDEAIVQYQHAMACNPRYVEAFFNLGVVYKMQGKLDEAIAAYRCSLKLNPNFQIGRVNLSMALTEFGNLCKLSNNGLQAALAAYEEALSYNYQYAEAHYNLGVALAEAGQPVRAQVAYHLAVHFDPFCAEGFNNLGVLHKEQGNFEASLSCCLTALAINPRFAQAHNNAGVVYTLQGRYVDALMHFNAAIEALPTYAEAFNNLGVLHRDEGEVAASIFCYEQSLRLDPNLRNAGQNLLFSLNYLDRDGPDALFDAHRLWGEKFSSSFAELRPLLAPARVRAINTDPLRVAYLSPDLVTHSVSYFVEAPARFHDRRRVKCIALSAAAKEDDRSAYLRTLFDEWHRVAGMPTLELARLVRELHVDVLVELTGHTAGNRLDVMALHPAPLTATWIGYPNTTGLAEVDVRFGDAVADPPESPQRYTERLVRLPHCFLCYTPPHITPEVPEAPYVANGFVTVGTFNNLAKISRRVTATWAKILLRAPQCKLLVKSKLFASSEIRERFVRRLHALGVEPNRVTAIGLLPTNYEHLESYRMLDLALDTFQYSGTTTTAEALWMGVPVLTWSAKTTMHAQNVTASMLAQLPEPVPSTLITDSPESYVQRAVELIENPEKLGKLRKMRDMMLQSRLCNGEEFTRSYEDTLYRLVEEKASGTF